MGDAPEIAVCKACGATAPRADMFGVQDDLRCEACAQGLRDRHEAARKTNMRSEQTHFLSTKVILGIAIGLYVLTHFVFHNRETPAWLLALYQSPAIWDGQWWRHVTAMFFHGGTLHILMNGTSIWSIGRTIDIGWGGKALVGLVLFTGVAGHAAQWIASPYVSAVGLSGGLFGLIGFLWALKDRHPIARGVMTPGMQQWVLIFSAACLIASWTGWYPIGNTAHFVGGAAGFAFGRAWDHRKRKLLVPLVAAGCLGVVVLAHFLSLGTVELVNGESISGMTAREWYLEGVFTDSPHHKGPPPSTNPGN